MNTSYLFETVADPDEETDRMIEHVSQLALFVTHRSGR